MLESLGNAKKANKKAYIQRLGGFDQIITIIVQQPSSLTLCFYIRFTTNYCTTLYSRVSIHLGPNKVYVFQAPLRVFYFFCFFTVTPVG